VVPTFSRKGTDIIKHTHTIKYLSVEVFLKATLVRIEDRGEPSDRDGVIQCTFTVFGEKADLIRSVWDRATPGIVGDRANGTLGVTNTGEI
jgi:hypothetical protein